MSVSEESSGEIDLEIDVEILLLRKTNRAVKMETSRL